MVATNGDGKGAVIVEEYSDGGKRCVKIKATRREAPWRLVFNVILHRHGHGNSIHVLPRAPFREPNITQINYLTRTISIGNRPTLRLCCGKVIRSRLHPSVRGV